MRERWHYTDTQYWRTDQAQTTQTIMEKFFSSTEWMKFTETEKNQIKVQV